jgi:hypothetical protein
LDLEAEYLVAVWKAPYRNHDGALEAAEREKEKILIQHKSRGNPDIPSNFQASSYGSYIH